MAEHDITPEVTISKTQRRYKSATTEPATKTP